MEKTTHSIFIPTAVSCELKRVKNTWIVWTSGPFGTLQHKIYGNFQMSLGYNSINFQDDPKIKKFGKILIKLPGLTDNFLPTILALQKMIVSSAIGFRRYLRVRGVGYKFVSEKPGILTINVGYSHVLTQPISDEIQIKATRKFRMIRLRSKGLSTLTGILSKLRNLSKPDVYRGKGIRYRWYDKTLRKEGKKRRTF